MSELKHWHEKAEEAKKEGLKLTYQGVDEDLPEFILSNKEDDFWSKQYQSAGLGEENARKDRTE
jgi:hypothetical protein